jgi:hypothetical protein
VKPWVQHSGSQTVRQWASLLVRWRALRKGLQSALPLALRMERPTVLLSETLLAQRLV